MKTKVTDNKVFQPITIQLVIESEKELKALHNQLRCFAKSMDKTELIYGDIIEEQDDLVNDLFMTLDSLVINLNI